MPDQDTIATPVWNKRGHGVVAFIARDVLLARNPDAWTKIDDVLQSDPRGRSSIAKASRWPDDMKSDPDFRKRTSKWHYVDIVWVEGTEPHADAPLPESPHAEQKLPDFLEEFDTTNAQKRADALSWILHVVGDLHMPLHCATRVNDEHKAPQGDDGGNGFHLWIGGFARGLSHSRVRRVRRRRRRRPAYTSLRGQGEADRATACSAGRLSIGARARTIGRCSLSWLRSRNRVDTCTRP
jgi:hypothetical protein